MNRFRTTTQPLFRLLNESGYILAVFQSRPLRTTRHVCSNVVIDVEGPATARGTSAMLLFNGGPAPLVDSFHDRFALTADGWRFAERRGSLTFKP